MSKKTLVIVESPTKAKTISRFLSKDYIVKSSYGHIRDLPKSKLGIDVKKNFDVTYTVPAKAKKTIASLKKDSEKSSEIILATDEDREGEAIAFHLAHLLNIDPKTSKRIVFHEITKNAITDALENPRHVDMNLVDAQQARRVLDRIVGYKLSPFLWKKIRYGLSAGRVQSVAVRLVVEREQERDAFNQEEYWTLLGIFTKVDDDKKPFEAKLVKRNGKTLKKLAIENEKESKEIESDLAGASYKITSIEKKERKRTPPPPFITSTLQQDAAYKLHFSAKKTMTLAQKLYEGINTGKGQTGLITYMRTDSVNLSKQALLESSTVITKTFGKEYALPSPRFYKKKSKNAQEAHEAIRPTMLSRKPEDVKDYLERDMLRLYDLIWKRTIACQMKEALLDATRVDIETKTKNENSYTFRANGNLIKFDGYTRAYTRGNENNGSFFEETLLPELSESEPVNLSELKKEQHFTEPPPRYSEATLVKTLEEYGIGRPSTYAPTIGTIQQRGYVEKETGTFKPTDTGILVTNLLVKHFPQTVDYTFTANLEEDLDKIARNEKEWVPVVKEFYTPFMENLKKKEKEVSKKELTEEKTDEKCEKCQSPMIIKMGRFGRFMACSNYPECKNTKPFGKDKEVQEEFSDATCEKCSSKMVVKHGRYGQFLGCSKYPDCKSIQRIEKKTGVACPKCNKGEIVEKKSKKGRVFYACNTYPDCKHALWQKPTGKKCPDCESLMVHAAKKTTRCSNKDCPKAKAKKK
ncbi:type I DNA topoisomerase [Patescibacteria group bacterium]|nr:type I DNA topoisomerase [Patescibacteria group bacterium]